MQIEPCPCCGNTWCEAREHRGGTYYWVRCNKCGYDSGDYKTKQQAIAAHNALSIKVQQYEQYKRFAERARPLFIRLQDLVCEEDCNEIDTCLAAYPEKPKETPDGPQK